MLRKALMFAITSGLAARLLRAYVGRRRSRRMATAMHTPRRGT